VWNLNESSGRTLVQKNSVSEIKLWYGPLKVRSIEERLTGDVLGRSRRAGLPRRRRELMELCVGLSNICCVFSMRWKCQPSGEEGGGS
jgi:hypothetical protein